MMERRRREKGVGHRKVHRKKVVGMLEDTVEDRQDMLVVDMLAEDMLVGNNFCDDLLLSHQIVRHLQLHRQVPR